MFKLFKKLNYKQYIAMCLSFVLIVGQVWLDLKLPDYMNSITTLIQTNGAISEIWKNGGYMLACALGSLLLSFVVGFFTAKIAAGLSMRLRSDVYNSVSNFSKGEINKFTTSSLITRTTNDITQVQMFFAMGLQMLIKAPVLAVWAIIKIAGKSWQWSLTTATAVCVLLVMITVLIIFCLPKFKIVQKQTDEINRLSRENLTGLRIVKAFNAEAYQEEKFEKANNNLTKTQLTTSTLMSMLSPTMTAIMSGLSLAIYWVGASIIKNANMLDRIGLYSDMMVFMSYSVQIISAFIMLAFIFVLMPRAIISAKRINEILDTKSSITDGKGATPTEVGTIKFDNVDFKYPNGQEDVLSNINLDIKKGEFVAFIGATGCGKSTLVDLVPRFFDATSGTVYVDGVDVKDYKLNDLHNRIGYVSQKAVLFTGTVLGNVTLGTVDGKKVSTEDAAEAINRAQASEFVDKMSEKEQSYIATSGKNISGGQKQRLSIARAIARKPEFLIFDDSFSALDYATDKKLRATLKKDFKGTTILLVAQRIGTIKDADKIVVLEDGKIVGVGKHKDLLDNCKTYKDIALSQLSKEEIDGTEK